MTFSTQSYRKPFVLHRKIKHALSFSLFSIKPLIAPTLNQNFPFSLVGDIKEDNEGLEECIFNITRTEQLEKIPNISPLHDSKMLAQKDAAETYKSHLCSIY